MEHLEIKKYGLSLGSGFQELTVFSFFKKIFLKSNNSLLWNAVLLHKNDIY